MKKVMCGIVTSIILASMLVTNVYAYENEIFKIDIPSDYVEMTYGGVSAFAKNENDGVMIYAYEDGGIKKDINSLTKAEVDQILSVIADKESIIEQKKEKLGKSKALKARVYDDNAYMDIYVVTSDKHILLVAFVAPTLNELEGEQFTAMKKSFKMKERTTNISTLRIGGFALAATGGIVYEIKKRKTIF